MSETWDAIQAIKNKQSSMRARMRERKRQRQDLAAEIKNESSGSTSKSETPASSLSKSSLSMTSSRSASPAPPPSTMATSEPEVVKSDVEVEKKLLLVLCDISLDIPSNASVLATETSKLLCRQVKLSAIEHLLEKFAAQQLISIITKESADKSRITVSSLDLSKLSAVSNDLVGSKSLGKDDSKRRRDSDKGSEDGPASKLSKVSASTTDTPGDLIESLLSMQSAKERENKKLSEEILSLLSKPTAKEQSLVEQFKSQGGQLQEFCPCGTKEECTRMNGARVPCKKLHFRKIIHKHTDESLGDCSFLNTCFHMDTCKYVHYEIDYPERQVDGSLLRREAALGSKLTDSNKDVTMYPSQWVQCDLRYFDMSVLGKCAVVMADPPWDIHMELPYGTMSDDEMRKLDVPGLQDDGFLFLWVTGRAMELGRECLELWGYKRVDELIWVKTNQLQRIIRTGRTGHWLNHGKEHCLVGVKGNPKGVNNGLDCDVIVAEVRATSHKPDEIYGIIERLSPGTRKVELFGRPHNVQPNWITLGNQVEGVKLLDPDIVKSFKERYPDGNCMAPPKHR
ncbi:N6-adenosine-methyltransferase subunit METTL3-like [Liolophura sinensis]|uniref:N6-adenosine-methyltransferase subunit METTL3-like n=1 Tax=Liolophura sinensis TaxID=3198878 RepID=UPI0031586608